MDKAKSPLHGITRREVFRRGALLLFLGQAQLSGGTKLLALRAWPAQDYTRLTLESDTPLRIQHKILTKPTRLVIDIQGINIQGQINQLLARIDPHTDPYIANIRLSQYQPDLARMVIDLKQETIPQIFALPPVAAYRHRLLIDLHPLTPPDPLEQLIERFTQTQNTPTQNTQEPQTTASGEDIETIIAQIRNRSQGASAAAPNASDTTHDAFEQLIAQHSQNTNPHSSSTPKPAPKSIPVPSKNTPHSPPPPATAHAAAGSKRLIIIAIDPGHGGEDPGAIGPGGSYEKHITLAIAQKLSAQLQGLEWGGNRVQTFLTREGDYFVPLHTRIQKAQRIRADLFISIHADAFITPQARGASVFALSTGGASSSAARWMAKRENLADAIGGIHLAHHDRTISRAFLDMSTTAQIRDSLQLGGQLLQQIGQFARLHKPRVEQAGFAVLKSPDIPSVLIETAFISNPEEEQLLRSDTYQVQLVGGLVQGIKAYFAKNPPLARGRKNT